MQKDDKEKTSRGARVQGAAEAGAKEAVNVNESAALAKDAMDVLVRLQSAAGMLYAREAERIAVKHGVADPRTQRVMQTARGAQDALKALENVRLMQTGEAPIEERLKEQREKAPPPPAKPTPKPKPKPARKAVTFNLRGQVMRADGKPASGVLVRVYDKDVKYDDLLGAALTNRKGEFAVSYRIQDFAENETEADLYFVVVNASDKVLLTEAADVKFDADYTGEVTLMIRGEGEETVS